LVDPQKVLLSPVHIKLGLMKLYREMETVLNIFAVNSLVFQKENLNKGFLWDLI
jgi:hypothetical protein